ncbi:MAG: ATP-binding protein [Myxococcota bacterium]
MSGAMNFIGVLSGAGLAVLGGLASRALRRDPVALPLALLAVDLALWNVATILFQATGDPVWHWLDVSFSPFTPPLVLHFILAYIGSVRRYRAPLVAAYAVFGALAASSWPAFFATWARTWLESSAWSVIYLAGWFPIMTFCLVLLVRALRAAGDNVPAAWRARLLIAALLLAGVLGSTELSKDFIQVPTLGVLGSFLAMLLMTAVVLRFDLLVGDPRRSMLVYVATIGILAATVLAIVLAIPNLDFALLLSIVLGVLVLVALAVREVVQSGAQRRARGVYLASLGRFSAQMAHDLKNPLAAMKGAVQYLQGEPGVPADPDMLALMAQQVGRMEAIIERYRRLARTEVVATEWSPDALASEVARALTVGNERVALAVEVEPAASDAAPTAWRGDRDLVASALENLVRNALDAMPDGGKLAVRTRRAGRALTLEVEDDGAGIEPRYLEQVADDFFTTKAQGSGLGLAFARRVAEAHDGGLAIVSAPGRGTRVTLTMYDRTR